MKVTLQSPWPSQLHLLCIADLLQHILYLRIVSPFPARLWTFLIRAELHVLKADPLNALLPLVPFLFPFLRFFSHDGVVLEDSDLEVLLEYCYLVEELILKLLILVVHLLPSRFFVQSHLIIGLDFLFHNDCRTGRLLSILEVSRVGHVQISLLPSTFRWGSVLDFAVWQHLLDDVLLGGLCLPTNHHVAEVGMEAHR